jgi:hypothetical protein
MKFDYYYRFIANTSYTKFFGITIGNMLYWKSHIDQILPKLIAAFCGVPKAFMIQETLVIVYQGYFHLVMNYGKSLGGYSLRIVSAFSVFKKNNYCKY